MDGILASNECVIIVFVILSRFRGMMNTPQLVAQFLGVAHLDTARLAARSFIYSRPDIDIIVIDMLN